MKRFSYRERDYTFGQTMLGLRTALNLTQADLAARMGVSRRAVGRWEGGSDYPKVKHLKQLIVLAVTHGVWPADDAAEKIRELWQAAHQKAPLDERWLTTLLHERASFAPARRSAGDQEVQPGASLFPPSSGVRPEGARDKVVVDWGEALTTPTFYGRGEELATLRCWLVEERCRVVSVLGMGGIGKSTLVVSAIRQVAAHFEVVIFRSLRDAPSCASLLDDCLRVLDPQPLGSTLISLEARISRLLEHLRSRRVLLVLDNVETLLAAGDVLGHLRAELEEYSLFLQRVGETAHASCLVLTSREQLSVLRALEGSHGPVRALRLAGLDAAVGAQLLAAHDLIGSVAEQTRLVEAYGGNPLALQIVAQTIVELFGGVIGPFLAQGAMVFGSIAEQIGAQITRLSALEQTILYWLAVMREPVMLAELRPMLASPPPPRQFLETVDSLSRHCLVERGQRPGSFTLQTVVLEYLTDRLVDQVAKEINSRAPDLLATLPLVQATAKDYVRQSQERLIGRPILQQLGRQLGNSAIEQQLLTVLESWRNRPALEQGYGPGNVVNLLRLLRGDLRGLDLSRLAIRQAYLAAVDAQNARLVDAQLAETVLAEAFHSPGSVALSGDGALLGAGTTTGQVLLWRVADRTLLWAMQGHSSAIWGVALSSDGLLLVSGGTDGKVRLWDARNGRALTTLVGHSGASWGAALSGDGRLRASSGSDGTVRLWEAGAERPLTLEGHSGTVWRAALSADGRLAASGGEDGTVRLWETGTGRPLAILKGHSGAVWSVALSSDGRLAASGGEDGTVRLWETSSGRPLARFEGHSGTVWRVALSSDGRVAASGGEDGTVRLWETSSGRPLVTLEGHSGALSGVALSNDGRLLASGSGDGTVRLWEARTGRPVATLQGHTGALSDVALSSDGRLLAGGGEDGTVRLWETSNGRPVASFERHSGTVRAVALSADGRLFASGSADGTVRLWETSSRRMLVSFVGPYGAVRAVALSADGHLLASGGSDGQVRLWETGHGRLTVTLKGHSGTVRALAISNDGRLLASGSTDGSVRLWETDTGQPVATLEGHSGAVRGVALSADGRLLASGGSDRTVRLWETSSARPLATLEGHSGTVWRVALSADGRLLASGGEDGTVRLWEANSGRPLATLEGHAGAVTGVGLSADGQVLASGSSDGTVRLWDARSGAHRATLQAERRYEGMDITGLTGITEAQRQALLALGAVKRR